MFLNVLLIHNRRSILDFSTEKTVMSHLKPENAPTNSRAYRVFREVIKDPENAYSSNIAERMEISQGDASHILTVLAKKKMLQKGKKTRAQYYKPNYKAISEYQAKILDSEETISENILKEYLDLYVKFNKESTIQEMLRDDFITIFSAYRKYRGTDHEVIDFLESLENSELYDRRFFEIAETVIEESEEKS